MGDAGGRVEIVIEHTLLFVGVLGRGVILELEALVLSDVFVEARVEVGIGPSHVGDVEGAGIVRLIERIRSGGLLGDRLVDFGFSEGIGTVQTGFCHK